MTRNHIITILLISLFAISSCKEDDSPMPETNGTLTLHFDNVVGDKNLELETGTYTNSSNEEFSINTLKYFISNISLKTASGMEYVIPKDSSYFLVDESDEESQDILLKNIPAGDYNQVTFTIGVDSLRSVADVSQRQGVLDPAETDMYWNWNPGYIFFKMEGESSAASAENEHAFVYHIGGYGGFSADKKTINNIKTVTIDMGSDKAQVNSTIEPEVHLYLDIMKVFNSDPALSIAEHPVVMFADYSTTIAKHYAQMVEYGHVHNAPKGK